MATFDEDFEEFQRQLSEIANLDPLIWRLRDSIYHDLHYARVGHDESRRHRLGKVTWNAWLVRRLIQAQFGRNAFQVNHKPARYGFLFYGPHAAHFGTLLPIVREIAVHEPVAIWWLALHDEQLSILRGLKNVDLISIEPLHTNAGWSPRSCMSDVRSASQSLARLTEFPSTDRSLVRQKASQITETIFEYLRWKRIWQSLDRTLPELALFVTSESTPVAKAFCDVMREAGRKIIHFLHGLPNTTHQVTNATDLCVYSESQKKWFEQRVGPDVEVRTIGNPRLEELRKSVTPPRARNSGEPFRLLYFSQTTGTYYGREQRRTDLSILSAQGWGPTKFSLRVRPHPSEPLKVLQEDLASSGLTNFEFSGDSLVEDLSWCDVAATNFSTALLEAAVCGRVCYWITTTGHVFDSVKALCQDGIGKSIRSQGDWQSEIDRASKLETSAPAQISDAQLHSLKILPEQTRPWMERLNLSRTSTLPVSQ